jgi:hypothetical protein
MTQIKTLVTETKNHSPFGLRKAMIFVGIVSGLAAWKLSQNIYLGLCVHLVVATLLDQLAHYGFHLKASRFVDPKELLVKEKTPPEALDRHYEAKRNIRLISLCIATVSQAILLSPELFLGLFAATTLVGRFYAWYKMDIVGQKVVHDMPMEEVMAWRQDQDEEVTLGLLGFGPYKSLKPDY